MRRRVILAPSPAKGITRNPVALHSFLSAVSGAISGTSSSAHFSASSLICTATDPLRVLSFALILMICHCWCGNRTSVAVNRYLVANPASNSGRCCYCARRPASVVAKMGLQGFGYREGRDPGVTQERCHTTPPFQRDDCLARLQTGF